MSRIVLIQPRSITAATVAELLTKLTDNVVIGSGNDEKPVASELFSKAIDGAGALFVGASGGFCRDKTTATTAVTTVMNPVVTPISVLPVDTQVANASMTDGKAALMYFHIFDKSTHTPSEAFSHKALTLASLKSYIGGAAVAAIGKVKVADGDGEAFLSAKIKAGTSTSFVSIVVTPDAAGTAREIKFTATTALSSQFASGTTLTIETISGGTI